jgi:hypothetical protein
MAFALTAVRIEESMKLTGCPICRLGIEAAAHSVDSFLWENVNDPVVRKPITDAYGFCPEHTRLLVATEMASSGPVLGVNMIYAQLGKLVGNELKQLSFGQRVSQTLQGLWRQISNGNGEKTEGQYLAPSGPCPVCALQAQANLNTLTALFEELENAEDPLWIAYQASDGICLAHLRMGLDHLASRFPQAAKRIAEDASRRLLQQSTEMLEYIRKNNWEYRQEQIKPEESAAWRKTLTFFTGFPGAKFTFKVEDFEG